MSDVPAGLPPGTIRLPAEAAEQWHSQEAPKFQQQLEMALRLRVAREEARDAESFADGVAQGAKLPMSTAAAVRIGMWIAVLATIVLLCVLGVVVNLLYPSWWAWLAIPLEVVGVLFAVRALLRIRTELVDEQTRVNTAVSAVETGARDSTKKAELLQAEYDEVQRKQERSIRVLSEPKPESTTFEEATKKFEARSA